MILWPDCIPCTLKMILDVARTTFETSREVDAFMREVLTLPAFSSADWSRSSPEVVGDIWAILVERSGVIDPFSSIKEQENVQALALSATARDCLAVSPDPFVEAAKMALVGNAIDAMVGTETASAETLLSSLGDVELETVQVTRLRERLQAAGTLAYIVDNCGEIVFDRLFLEVLTAEYSRLHVSIITHTVPILNDALLSDALAVGLDAVGHVMENGARIAFPGNFVSEMGPPAHEVVSGADLVISKGVANYELLSTEGVLDGRITYMLHGKCHPICSVHQADRGALIMRNC